MRVVRIGLWDETEVMLMSKKSGNEEERTIQFRFGDPCIEGLASKPPLSDGTAKVSARPRH